MVTASCDAAVVAATSFEEGTLEEDCWHRANYRLVEMLLVWGILLWTVPVQVLEAKVIVGVGGDGKEEIDLGMDGDDVSCYEGDGAVVMVPDERSQQEEDVPVPTQLVP